MAAQFIWIRQENFCCHTILFWEKDVRSAVLITGLSQDWGQEIRRYLWRLPSPASCSNQGQLQLVCDKNCCKLGGACSLPEHGHLPGRGDASSPLDAEWIFCLFAMKCSCPLYPYRLYKEISRGDWVKETNTKERKPESVRMDYFSQKSAVSQDLGILHSHDV